jgi:hypothetical protein
VQARRRTRPQGVGQRVRLQVRSNSLPGQFFFDPTPNSIQVQYFYIEYEDPERLCSAPL